MSLRSLKDRIVYFIRDAEAALKAKSLSDWTEELHPRDEAGKFSVKGGGESGYGSYGKGEGPVRDGEVFYHGTASDALAGILKNGIQPLGLSGPKKAFVSTSKDEAVSYAKMRAMQPEDGRPAGMTAIVIEVRVPVEHLHTLDKFSARPDGKSSDTRVSAPSIPPEWIVSAKALVADGIDGWVSPREVDVKNLSASSESRWVVVFVNDEKSLSCRSRLALSDFDEDLHPRDENGKFTDGGGSNAAPNATRDNANLIRHVSGWSASKPWDASKDDLSRGIAGVTYNRNVRSVARHIGEGRIEVGDKFFELPTNDVKRVVLYHEAGHGLSDAMLEDGSAWDALDAGILPGGKQVANQFDHLNGQTTPGEVISEAYSVLHDEPEFVESRWPDLATLCLLGKIWPTGTKIYIHATQVGSLLPLRRLPLSTAI